MKPRPRNTIVHSVQAEWTTDAHGRRHGVLTAWNNYREPLAQLTMRGRTTDGEWELHYERALIGVCKDRERAARIGRRFLFGYGGWSHAPLGFPERKLTAEDRGLILLPLTRFSPSRTLAWGGNCVVEPDTHWYTDGIMIVRRDAIAPQYSSIFERPESQAIKTLPESRVLEYIAEYQNPERGVLAGILHRVFDLGPRARVYSRAIVTDPTFTAQWHLDADRVALLKRATGFTIITIPTPAAGETWTDLQHQAIVLRREDDPEPVAILMPLRGNDALIRLPMPAPVGDVSTGSVSSREHGS